MSRCALAKLIREEIDNLSRIAEALEDKSKLCYPIGYDCAQCLREAERNLKRIQRLSKGVYYTHPMDMKLSHLMGVKL